MKRFLPLVAVFAWLLSPTVQLSASSLVNGTLYSPTMQKDVNYSLRIPNSYTWNPKKIFPVLYALHGYGAPYTTWTSMNPLNNAIDNAYPAIVATFDGEDSFYLDFKSDSSKQFTTFFFEEFVPFIETTYRAGRSPGMRAVTGFSMGGFGAWHYMLEKPDFFCSVSSLSGAYDRDPDGQTDKNPYTRIAADASNEIDLPPMYMNCGTDDGLISDQRNMANLLAASGYTYEAVETPGYAHEWAFWRDYSDEVITFHFQYFHEAPATWRGFPLQDGYADAGQLGWVQVSGDPWIWVMNLSGWAWLDNGFGSNGGWIWLSQ